MKRGFYHEYYEIEGRHWWFVGRRRIFTTLLERHLPAAPAGRRRRILDVGCGTGTMVQVLGRLGDATGVDSSPDAIELCRRRGVESVTRASGVPLPFAEASFDLVTLLDVLEHVDRERETLLDIGRVLRPGGNLLVSVPAYRFLWGAQDEISEHRRRYTRRELGDRLREAGFEIRRLTYFNTLLFPPIAAIRLLRPYRPGSDDLRSDFTLTRSEWTNRLLGRVFGSEAALLRRADLPFGVSVLALAAKPAPGR